MKIKKWQSLLWFVPLLFIISCGEPNFITSSIVDPSNIEWITPINSCCGHQYGLNETSQKHYLSPISGKNQSDSSIKIYAPCEGTISLFPEENCRDNNNYDKTDYKVSFACLSNLSKNVKVFHVILNPNIKNGAYVNSGMHIGYASLDCKNGENKTFDIALEGILTYESIFDYMTKEAFSSWKTRGLSESDLTLDKSKCAHFQQCQTDKVSF